MTIVGVYVRFTVICVIGYNTRVIALIVDEIRIADITLTVVHVGHCFLLGCLICFNYLMLRFLAQTSKHRMKTNKQSSNRRYESEVTTMIAVINASFIVNWLPENTVTILMMIFKHGAIHMTFETFQQVMNVKIFLDLLFSFNSGLHSAIYLSQVKRFREFYVSRLPCAKKIVSDTCQSTSVLLSTLEQLCFFS